MFGYLRIRVLSTRPGSSGSGSAALMIVSWPCLHQIRRLHRHRARVVHHQNLKTALGSIKFFTAGVYILPKLLIILLPPHFFQNDIFPLGIVKLSPYSPFFPPYPPYIHIHHIFSTYRKIYTPDLL